MQSIDHKFILMGCMMLCTLGCTDADTETPLDRWSISSTDVFEDMRQTRDMMFDQSGGDMNQVVDIAIDQPIDKDMTLVDMSIDMKGERLLYGQATSVPDSSDEGFGCGQSSQCMPGQLCESKVFFVCVDQAPERSGQTRCDDGRDCENGKVCCLDKGTTCVPRDECEGTKDTLSQNKGIVCSTDSDCEGGYCCEGTAFSERTNLNVCQPTPCETCYFEPGAYCLNIDFGQMSEVGQNASYSKFYRVIMKDADLRQTLLDGSTFAGNFERTLFNDASLKGTAFLGNVGFFSYGPTTLKDAQFKRTIFGKLDDATTSVESTFYNVDAENSDFDQADLSFLQIRESSFVQAKFVHVIATNVRFTMSNFDSSSWRNANLMGGEVIGCDFTNADFANAVLKDMTFISFRTKFSKASFKNADLRGSQFLISPMAFEGAIWSGATCPDGTKADTNQDQTCIGHLTPAP